MRARKGEHNALRDMGLLLNQPIPATDDNTIDPFQTQNSKGKKKFIYETQKLIGQGGLGQLYHIKGYFADQVIEGKKLYRKSYALKKSIKDNKKDIMHQYKIMKLLKGKSPYFIEVFYKDPRHEFIIMEYLKHYIDMSVLFKEQRALLIEQRLPVPVRHTIASQLLSAISVLHSEVMVAHNDMKPGNVMVDLQKPHVKLIDFGLSVKKNHAYKNPVGTYKYYPPEMLLSLDITTKKSPVSFGYDDYLKYDLWGVGIVLEMLFDKDFQSSIIQKSATDTQDFYKKKKESKTVIEKKNKELQDLLSPTCPGINLLSYKASERVLPQIP